MSNSQMELLFEKIRAGELTAAALSSPWSKQSNSPTKLSIRPILVKGQLLYQVTAHLAKHVTHRNLSQESCCDLVQQSFPDQFRQGVFSTEETSFHVLVSSQKAVKVLCKQNAKKSEIPLAHNRQKKYLLQDGEPIPFLIGLGIMTEQGKVIAKKYDKFRQINHFIGMVSDVMDHLPTDRPIEIIDFGCGKAYLTFALYYYLHHVVDRPANMTGLDLKEEVIVKCRVLAKELEYHSLHFEVGDIQHHRPKGKVDLVITLHACDTATDAALEKAVKWDAGVILCVPCCQHELFNQIQCKTLSSLLRHGILRERFAALATDAARADLLTVQGYTVDVLEFIDMEHTPKNLLLRAVKKTSLAQQKQAAERYHRFKEALHIIPSLEKSF